MLKVGVAKRGVSPAIRWGQQGGHRRCSLEEVIGLSKAGSTPATRKKEARLLPKFSRHPRVTKAVPKKAKRKKKAGTSLRFGENLKKKALRGKWDLGPTS